MRVVIVEAKAKRVDKKGGFVQSHQRKKVLINQGDTTLYMLCALLVAISRNWKLVPALVKLVNVTQFVGERLSVRSNRYALPL